MQAPAILRATTLPVQVPATLRDTTLRASDLIDCPPGEPKISGNAATMGIGRISATPGETGAMDPGVTGTIAEVEMTDEGILTIPGRMGETAMEMRARIRVSETTGPVKEQERAREECTGMVKTNI